MDEIYFYDLKMICGGYAYFSTYTSFNRFGENFREYREPSTASYERFSEAAKLLGQNPFLIRDENSLQHWLVAKGWAFIDEDYAKRDMTQWLKQRECVNTATGAFTDIAIVSPSTMKRSYSGKRKKEVVKRDGGKCLICGITDNLTMQHVVPYSKGGETTSRNMVTLCAVCNQKLENNIDLGLFEKAGLHYRYERSLINHNWYSDKHRAEAAQITDNLMQTRCELW